MKHFMFAIPAVALLAVAASAQTDTSTTTGAASDASTAATGEMFGTSWPLSVGTTFFAGSDSATLRGTEEITSGWASLSQEDRDMVMADCKTFTSAHGDAVAGGAEETTTGTTAETGMSDTATTGTAGTDTATGADATATTGAESSTTVAAGYDMTEMKAICDTVSKL
jgi:hypothetical protein